MKRFSYIVVLLPFLALLGCNSGSESENTPTDDELKLQESLLNSAENKSAENEINAYETDGAIVIYYNLPSPSEMAKILEQSKVSFYEELPNPTSNKNKYLTTTKKALNMGVYGVDLNYIKSFNQNQLTLTYLSTVKDMVSGLGIPQDETKEAMDLLEQSLGDKNKLNNLINKIYEEAQKYLNDSQRESAATLAIIGGWVEGMYLATQIYEKGEKSNYILNRIAEQKYALNNVIKLTVDQQKDQNVKQFLPPLMNLKRIFDKVVLNFEDSNPKIDTINKVIVITDQTYVGISDTEIKRITALVKELRTEIVK